MTTDLHGERLDAVLATLRETGARSVLDLGCGDGDLLLRLAALPEFERITGIEIDAGALRRAQVRLAGLPAAARARGQLAGASLTQAHPRLAGYGCACLVEVIEHLPPGDINRLERAVFAGLRPANVLVATPNAEFNPVLGVPAHRFRHPDHRFEWTRARFARWGDGVAARSGYAVAYRAIGGAHPTLGGASQMALFRRADQAP